MNSGRRSEGEKVQTLIDLPEPDRLAEVLKIEVSQVRLEADPRWREAVEKLEARRSLRRVAESVYQYLGTPRDVLYAETAGILKPHDLAGGIDLRFIFKSGSEGDHFQFHLERGQEGAYYEVKTALKEFGEPWGGGVVPDTWKEYFLNVVRTHPVVWQLSERIVRIVEPKEIAWEWQPAWNLPNIPVPQGDAGLNTVFAKETDIPRFVILANWALTLEEHDWGAHGFRVQMLIDPTRESIVKAWEDEWHVLY